MLPPIYLCPKPFPLCYAPSYSLLPPPLPKIFPPLLCSLLFTCAQNLSPFVMLPPTHPFASPIRPFTCFYALSHQLLLHPFVHFYALSHQLLLLPRPQPLAPSLYSLPLLLPVTTRVPQPLFPYARTTDAKKERKEERTMFAFLGSL